MHAVDTNLVLRCLTNDDARQSPLARNFIDDHDVLVLSTVLVECEWVLRSVHRLPAVEIARLLRLLASLPTLSIERPQALPARSLGSSRAWILPTRCTWLRVPKTRLSPHSTASWRARRKLKAGKIRLL